VPYALHTINLLSILLIQYQGRSLARISPRELDLTDLGRIRLGVTRGCDAFHPRTTQLWTKDCARAADSPLSTPSSSPRSALGVHPVVCEVIAYGPSVHIVAGRNIDNIFHWVDWRFGEYTYMSCTHSYKYIDIKTVRYNFTVRIDKR